LGNGQALVRQYNNKNIQTSDIAKLNIISNETCKLHSQFLALISGITFAEFCHSIIKNNSTIFSVKKSLIFIGGRELFCVCIFPCWVPISISHFISYCSLPLA
jgi:hypothetical protein